MQSHSKIPFSDGLQNTSLDTKFKRAFNNTEVHLNVLRAAIALFILEQVLLRTSISEVVPAS